MFRPLLALMLLLMPFPASADDTAKIAKWSDQAFGKAVTDGGASAATVIVVRDGKILFSRNYGYGDKATKAAIASPRDRFLIASLTKTFTATAVALLIQDGRIKSLDDPVNSYLKRTRLPDGFGRPITIRQLLTHSAGFEERGFGVGSHASIQVPASGDYVQSKLPAIVRRPGSALVYANIDPALLGVMVEDITGLTMREFMARRILQPLGMSDTELVYDKAATASLVRPYSGAAAIPWEINAPFYAPTGSIHTTSADMAKFLNAQLGFAPQVLPPAVVAMLHRPQARNDPALDPLGMAFFLSRWNGRDVIGHAGAFSGFGADMYVVPSGRLGVYYAWAGAPSPGGKALDWGELQSGLLTALFGAYQAPAPLVTQPDPSPYVGRYWQERRPQTTFESIVAAGSVTTVAKGVDNSLMIDGKGPYFAFAPGAYTKMPESGKPAAIYVFKGGKFFQRSGAATRVSGLGDPGTQVTLSFVALGLLATGLLGAIWMRGRARLFAPLVGTLALAVPLLLYVIPPGLEADIIAGNVWRFTMLKIIGIAIAALSLVLAWTVLRGVQGRLVKGHAVLLALAGLVLLVPFRFFHLV